MKKTVIFFILTFPILVFAQGNKQSLTVENNSKVFEILKNVKENEEKNRPDYLNSYQYHVYSKFFVDDLSYNYSQNIDSIALPKSTQTELLFLGERVTEYKYDKKHGKKNTVIAGQTSGFKEPFYELYNDRIFEEDFPDILKKDISLYNFKLIDSISINQRKTYVISFGVKRNILLDGSRGFLYIDAASFAVVKYSGEEYGADYNRFFEFEWKLYQNIWYPENKTLKIKFNNFDFSRFLGKKYPIQNSEYTPWLVIQSATRDFSQPNTFSRKDFQGYTQELKENFDKDSDTKIASYRPVPLNAREKQTYVSTSSLFDRFPIEKNIRTLSSLKKGELSLGKVDLDLVNLISFNDYEGFRFQLGGKTNYRFSQDYSLHGYGALGTKSTNLKGALGADFFINKKQDGRLGIEASSDVNPYSREIVRRPESLDQLKGELNFIQNALFYSYRKGEISYKQDFFKRFTTSFVVNYQAQRSEYEYSYKNNTPDHWFNLFSTSLKIKYAPFAEYMQTPAGKLVIEDKPVYFYFNYTRGWKGLNTDFDYNKFDLVSDVTVKNPWGMSNFFVSSGYISGETSLWNLYGSFGSAKAGNSVFNRFSVKGFHSLETMISGDFFADKYAALFFTHRFRDIPLWNTKKIQIALIYNALIGNMEHRDLHTLYYFQVPKNLYQEVGIEINKLISYFGLGAYYRFGAYNQGIFDDNLFIKLTFTLF